MPSLLCGLLGYQHLVSSKPCACRTMCLRMIAVIQIYYSTRCCGFGERRIFQNDVRYTIRHGSLRFGLVFIRERSGDTETCPKVVTVIPITLGLEASRASSLERHGAKLALLGYTAAVRGQMTPPLHFHRIHYLRSKRVIEVNYELKETHRVGHFTGQ